MRRIIFLGADRTLPASLPELDDLRWLLGPEAARLLIDLSESDCSSPAAVSALRKTLSSPRVHLLAEQIDLRRRGRTKFPEAERMFFSRRGLEQATDRWAADYKSRRFANDSPVADLCCGVGGDLTSLARRGPTTGVERDPFLVMLAEANLAAVGATASSVRCCDGDAMDLSGFAACHADPDRRPGDRRGVRLADHEPNEATVERWLQRQPNMALKLAPAAEPPAGWRERAECEWISRGGECKQLVVWHGLLAQGNTGLKSATAIRKDGSMQGRYVQATDSTSTTPSVVEKPGRHLFDPDAALLAAGLEGELAAELGLSSLGPGAAYFTGEQISGHGLFETFEVQDWMPLDFKRMQAWCRERAIGRLEIKKRGVPHDPLAVRRMLTLRGDQEIWLILTRAGNDRLAIFAKKLVP